MKKVYLVGIKGVGMTPLAIIAKKAGLHVEGSDVAEEFITDMPLRAAGIIVHEQFKEEHIKNFIAGDYTDTLVITTGAHGGFENEEVKYALKNGMTVWTQGKAVGEFMKGEILGKNFVGISVAGTHGKTTTTGMITQILTHMGEDPTYILGTSEVLGLGGPGNLGEGKFFIAEADEYISDLTVEKKAKLLYQFPKIACITNIDFDHPDVYNSIEDVEKVFEEFVNNLPSDSVVVACGNDENIRKVLSKTKRNYHTYGTSEKNTIQIKNITEGADGVQFTLEENGRRTKFHTSCSGVHNAYNAACALTALKTLGYNFKEMKQAVAHFKGTKRRSEEKGVTSFGATVVDDYAHHPVEIKTTLDGLKCKYDKKILCIFQPHTYTRTNAFLDDFAMALSVADELILMPIFASAREKSDNSLTNEEFTAKVKIKQPKAVYLKDTRSVIEYLKKRKLGSDYLIVTMGAGNVYKISDQIII